MNNYETRNKLLKTLGYSSYAEYLNSPRWEDIRCRAFKEYGNVCRLCGKEATVIHHKGYGRDVLLGFDLGQLSPLCDECHYKVEFYLDGTKRTLAQSQLMYSRLIAARREQLGVSPAALRILPGRCKVCGKIAKKKSRYCRPCRRRESRKQSSEAKHRK